ncbi:tetratricopeptide (TPR) repeat protein [Desulfobaculum xiamenense]|uniref:Tetratricopeptide (TPR) repeat protein n=1 Tax=Desulfobaculum xiamenense TaxID=995050 RepID=A0A846QNA5_9BACT|nr:tetratricopeptide repeat protein [Desulfobaculum xiamenense]NJB68500.1 tetratricopeptide (TPR) repeat protein [Desulfobaculum xiamenense]
MNLAGEYRRTLSERSQGTYQLQECTCFIIEIPAARQTKTRRELHNAALIEFRKLIRKHIASTALPSFRTDQGISARLNTLLTREWERSTRLPSALTTSGHILEDSLSRGTYRYAIAIPTRELNSLRQEAKSKQDNPQALLAAITSEAVRHRDFKTLACILWESGLHQLAARCALQDMNSAQHTVNYTFHPNAFEQRRSLRALLEGHLQPNDDILELLPGCHEVLERIAERTDIPEQAFALLELALADSGQAHSKLINKMIALTGNDRDFASLARTSPHAPDGNVFTTAYTSLGGLRFGDDISSASTSEFDEAKRLFHAGTDLPATKRLLLKSLESSPANREIWDYLGAILMAERQWREAIFTYLEMLHFNPLDAETLGHLAQAHIELGQTETARRIIAFAHNANLDRDNPTLLKISSKFRSCTK